MSQLQIFTDYSHFCQLARTLWQSQPALSNLQWALSERYAKAGEMEQAFILWREKEVYAVGIQTDPPRPLILTAVDLLTAAEVGLIEERCQSVTGLIASKELADNFLASSRMEPVGTVGLLAYQLDELIPGYQIPGGTFAPAEMSQIELLSDWVNEFLIFIEEIGGPENYQEKTAKLVESGHLYVYSIDGAPVAMAASTRSQGGVAAVNYVFTPEHLRGNGYAKAVVGELSAQLLRTHDHCVLYAEKDYPASNKVYQRLGYRVIGESVEVTF